MSKQPGIGELSLKLLEELQTDTEPSPRVRKLIEFEVHLVFCITNGIPLIKINDQYSCPSYSDDHGACTYFPNLCIRGTTQCLVEKSGGNVAQLKF